MLKNRNYFTKLLKGRVLEVSKDDTKKSVRDILKAHYKTSKVKNCLQSNIGDGYLLKNNRVYRNLRRLAIEAGFKFTTKHFENSQAFPFSSLDDYLERKLIPYNDNVSTLERLHRRQPKITLPRRHKLFEINYVFHESAHAYAHSLTLPLRKQSKDENSRFLFSLLEESFANTAERFSYVFCDNEDSEYFMFMNNYAHGIRVREKIFPEMPNDILEMYFGMCLFSSLYANYVFTKLDRKNFNQVIEVLRDILDFRGTLTAEDKRNLAYCTKLGMALNFNFRVVMNEFYVELQGFKTPLIELVKYDFMKTIRNSPKAKAIIKTLIRSALSDQAR